MAGQTLIQLPGVVQPGRRVVILDRYRNIFVGLSPLVLQKSSMLLLFFVLIGCFAKAQTSAIDANNIVWTKQSQHSGESMPCGGGDIGLNVWVENDELFFYIAQSGNFDENNALLKNGRCRIKLFPNPFQGGRFRQELILQKGQVEITAGNSLLSTKILLWVDVHQPVVHLSINSTKPVTTTATFESWRYQDRPSAGRENNANSYKWAPPTPVVTFKDEIGFLKAGVLFYHRNKTSPSIFDVTVKQQGLEAVKDELLNPIKDRQFGGWMEGEGMIPAGTTTGTYKDTDFKGWKLQNAHPRKSQEINIYLLNAQVPASDDWRSELVEKILKTKGKEKLASRTTIEWWQQFWQRSFVFMGDAVKQDTAWEVGRNYQLFRYMLACNTFGKYPTKFNGGLFTYDPAFVDSTYKFTPDFRNWGGGIHTAQNQRLVYFPLIRSGDFDVLKPQLDFYLHLLKTAELRSKVYWNHAGASFTEQLENFGLPNYAEYGTKRPANYDKGMEYNPWLEYEWDTVLEFCLMMLETERYAGQNIQVYLPFIESCLEFFDEHYQQLAKARGAKTFDASGHLVLYPGSAAETYKMAYNASSTVSGLKTILTRLLQLPAQYETQQPRAHWDSMLRRIPPISYASFEGHTTIAPAKLWERINNTETPQLYPLYPWGIFGIGRPGLDTALNTYRYDTNAIKFRSHAGWKQDNIFAARLGLREEAAALTVKKLQNSGRRFPAFWGPGFDWTPDHNWGGSGMIGLQEMLLQTDGEKIYMLPAWPARWDVHFKLHAPYNTTVECVLKNGKVIQLKVTPASRMKDLVNMLPQ
ncbi:MAG: DUF5703 domain-containing protein [Ferruginibacter sp.]|nr:DUF5703 domain-containing protein [Ferruginibacter sp.]